MDTNRLTRFYKTNNASIVITDVLTSMTQGLKGRLVTTLKQIEVNRNKLNDLIKIRTDLKKGLTFLYKKGLTSEDLKGYYRVMDTMNEEYRKLSRSQNYHKSLAKRLAHTLDRAKYLH